MSGRKSPFSITLAIGLYNSLYYRTSRDSPIANAAYKIIAIKNSNNNNKIIILNSGKSIFANVCPSVKNVYCVFFYVYKHNTWLLCYLYLNVNCINRHVCKVLVRDNLLSIINIVNLGAVSCVSAKR